MQGEVTIIKRRSLVPVSTKVEIDLGEMYAPLVAMSIREFRNLHQQILYMLKKQLAVYGIKDEPDASATYSRYSSRNNDVYDSIKYFAGGLFTKEDRDYGFRSQDF